MTKATHIVALLQSHFDGDDEHFMTVAMQAAANEARLGHGKVAQQLRDMVDEARAPVRLCPISFAHPTAGSPRHQHMPILGLKPTPCDDIGVVLRTLKTRACVSMDIRVDLAKETARPRHFFRRRKNDPAGRETTPKRAGGFGRFRVVDGSEGCRRRRP